MPVANEAFGGDNEAFGGDNEAFGGGQPKIYTLDLGLTKKTCSLKISYFQ